MPEAAAKRANDRLRDIRIGSAQRFKVCARKEEEASILQRDGRSRIWLPVEVGQLGDRSTGSLYMQHLRATFGIRAIDADAACLNDVEAAAFVTGGEQHV